MTNSTSQTLIDGLAAKAHAEDLDAQANRAKLRTEYAALLFRNANPGTGDGKRFTAVVAELGLDVAKVRDDIALVQTYQRALDLGAKARDLAIVENTARQAHESAKAKLESETDRLKAAVELAKIELERAEGRTSRARDALDNTESLADRLRERQLWPADMEGER